jgi:hypothetical protein
MVAADGFCPIMKRKSVRKDRVVVVVCPLVLPNKTICFKDTPV